MFPRDKQREATKTFVKYDYTKNIKNVFMKTQADTKAADEDTTTVVFRVIFKIQDYMKILYFCSHTKHYPQYAQKATKQVQTAPVINKEVLHLIPGFKS